MAMQIIIEADGAVRCVYGEDLDLTALGELTIRRASTVEPDAGGQWIVDLAPLNGPTLGPFPRRSEALQAEQEWLAANWLSQPSDRCAI